MAFINITYISIYYNIMVINLNNPSRCRVHITYQICIKDNYHIINTKYRVSVTTNQIIIVTTFGFENDIRHPIYHTCRYLMKHAFQLAMTKLGRKSFFTENDTYTICYPVYFKAKVNQLLSKSVLEGNK